MNCRSARARRCATNGGALDYVVGGWVINSVSIFQTGFPLQIIAEHQLQLGFRLCQPASQRHRQFRRSPAAAWSSGSSNYINPAAFSTAPQFTFGNVGRTIDMRGPGQVNWDMSLFKNFVIKEKAESRSSAWRR